MILLFITVGLLNALQQTQYNNSQNLIKAIKLYKNSLYK